MSLSLDTVLQVVDIAQRAIEIYQKIQDGPERMKKIGRRVERLKVVLVSLENHVRTNSKHPLARLRKSQTEHLLGIIDDTRDDCKKVHDLFEKWERNIGPWGLQWRFTSFGQAYFTLGTSSDKLETLAQDLENHQKDLDVYLGLMGAVWAHDNQVGIKKIQEDNEAMKKQLESIQKLLKAGQPIPTLAVAVSPPTDGQKMKKLSPSPSPLPAKTDYKIVFVDPYNVGRSVLAASLTALLKQWTVRTDGEWRIQNIHSAGFFVRGKCTEEIEALRFLYPSYKMETMAGGKPPSEMAVAALFDNTTYDYPFKQKERESVEKRKSKALARDYFKKYDYIIVFTSREHDNMIALRKALVAKDGKEAATKGMGRVLHLGRYLTLDGIPREIVEPPKNEDGSESRANWNWKVSQMKTAIKGFLKQEFKWKQPNSKAVVRA